MEIRAAKGFPIIQTCVPIELIHDGPSILRDRPIFVEPIKPSVKIALVDLYTTGNNISELVKQIQAKFYTRSYPQGWYLPQKLSEAFTTWIAKATNSQHELFKSKLESTLRDLSILLDTEKDDLAIRASFEERIIPLGFSGNIIQDDPSIFIENFEKIYNQKVENHLYKFSNNFPPMEAISPKRVTDISEEAIQYLRSNHELQRLFRDIVAIRERLEYVPYQGQLINEIDPLKVRLQAWYQASESNTLEKELYDLMNQKIAYVEEMETDSGRTDRNYKIESNSVTLDSAANLLLNSIPDDFGKGIIACKFYQPGAKKIIIHVKQFHDLSELGDRLPLYYKRIHNMQNQIEKVLNRLLNQLALEGIYTEGRSVDREVNLDEKFKLSVRRELELARNNIALFDSPINQSRTLYMEADERIRYRGDAELFPTQYQDDIKDIPRKSDQKAWKAFHEKRERRALELMMADPSPVSVIVYGAAHDFLQYAKEYDFSILQIDFVPVPLDKIYQ